MSNPSTRCPSLTSSISSSSSTLLDPENMSYFSDDDSALSEYDSGSDSDSDSGYDSDALDDDRIPPFNSKPAEPWTPAKDQYVSDAIFLDDIDVIGSTAAINLQESDYFSYRRRGPNPTKSSSKFSSLPRLTMPPSLYSTQRSLARASIELIDPSVSSSASPSSSSASMSPIDQTHLYRTSRVEHEEDIDIRFQRALAFASQPRRHRRNRTLPSHVDCGEESSDDDLPSRDYKVSPPHPRTSFLPQELINVLYSRP